MARLVYDPGDEVGYPRLDNPQGRLCTVIDRNVIRYASGKSYVQYLLDGLLEHLVEDMHANIDNDFDNLVVVSGKEGSGKSNLAYHLCKLFDPEFDLEDGYIYEFEAFIEKLASADGKDRGKIFWMDEATNIASNRDWMRSDNKTFIQMLEMMRSRGWTLVMCIPAVERLDVYIREYRLRYHLIARELSWEDRPAKSRGFVEVRFPKGAGTWFTIGYARFPQMTPEEKNLYESIKLKRQNEKIKEIQNKVVKEKRTKEGMAKDKEKIRRLVLYAHEQGATYVEIAQIVGCSRDHVKDMLRQARAERGQPEESE